MRDWQPAADVFVGRVAELERVAEILRRAADGQPWLVAIEGDPGMGKSALARHALEGTRLLTARAGQGEANLDYGLVDQLLRSAGRFFPEIRLGADPPASPFAVGARLLQVVDEFQDAGPIAILLEDLQWADRLSVQALTFMLRRLSVDRVVAVVTYRGPGRDLDEAAQRLLTGIEHRTHLVLGGLSLDEVAELAATVTTRPLSDQAVHRLYLATGGHPLYVRTVLTDGSGPDPRFPRRLRVPHSLADAIGDQLRGLPPGTRAIMEMLAVLNVRIPLAQLGQAAQAGSASADIEPALAAGLADWWPDEPSCPVQIRHLLVRDAIYAGITVTRRRQLHARAATLVSEQASWEHRVAALDRPDEQLAAQLERLAGDEVARGRLNLAATHLQWASDVSPARADRERRLMTAALHLTLMDEARGAALRPVIETAAPSPLRSCVLGTMAFSAGQLAEARTRLTEAMEQARHDPDQLPVAAVSANRLAATYTLLGDGEQGMRFGRWALEAGTLEAAPRARTRVVIAVAATQVRGPREALAELSYLHADPARVPPAAVDALAYRGMLRLLTGDLGLAVTDLAASVAMVNRGIPPTIGLRAYFWLALAQYLAGEWDDVLLTAEQALSAAAIHQRRFELPLLHLAAACVPASRGAAEAVQHVRLAEEAAASLDYRQERVYAAMARALLDQAAGDYLGMADSLRPWQGPDLDARSRVDAVLWQPLLAEGLIGSGQAGPAASLLDQLEGAAQFGGATGYLRPALAWLRGWQAELQESPEEALRIYSGGADAAGSHSPVYTARLLLAQGRLLRRTGNRKDAIECLRRARTVFAALRATPFTERTDQELAACHLPRNPAAKKKSYLELTSRETEVAHLVGKGLSNPEIAAELFISRKAVEYHLGNVYAKYGIRSRKQLRRLVEGWREPATV